MRTFRLIIVIAFLTALWLACGVAFAQSFKYDAPVTLEGTLMSSTADASITYDEKPHGVAPISPDTYLTYFDVSYTPWGTSFSSLYADDFHCSL